MSSTRVPGSSTTSLNSHQTKNSNPTLLLPDEEETFYLEDRGTKQNPFAYNLVLTTKSLISFVISEGQTPVQKPNITTTGAQSWEQKLGSGTLLRVPENQQGPLALVTTEMLQAKLFTSARDETPLSHSLSCSINAAGQCAGPRGNKPV